MTEEDLVLSFPEGIKVTIPRSGQAVTRKLVGLIQYLETYRRYGPDLMADIRRHNLSDKLLSLDAKNNNKYVVQQQAADKDDGKAQPQTFKLCDKLLTTELSDIEAEGA